MYKCFVVWQFNTQKKKYMKDSVISRYKIWLKNNFARFYGVCGVQSSVTFMEANIFWKQPSFLWKKWKDAL